MKKNSFDNTFTFVQIIAGKHAGEYGYIEGTFGKKIAVVSGKPDGERFECLVSYADVERGLSDNEMHIAKECALNFYNFDIKSKIEYINACDDAAEIERVAVIARDRIIKMSNIENIVL